MTTKRKPKPRRIQPRLKADLVERLEDHRARNGQTQAAVVEAAVEQYLTGTGDRQVMWRRLDRLDRKLDAVRQDTQIMTELIATFVQVYFAHAPEVPGQNHGEAKRRALARFDLFIEAVTERLRAGRSLLSELPLDRIAESRELDAARRAAPVPEPQRTA